MPRARFASVREERAIHEAGHAVMLLDLCLHPGIVFVTIDNRRAGGEICRKGLPMLRANRAVYQIAGLAAQALDFEGRNPGVDRETVFKENRDVCETDLEALEKDHGIHGARALAFMGECMERLVPLRSQLQALTCELLQHGTLYNQEAWWVYSGEIEKLRWYRANREVGAPPRPWVEGTAPGCEPRPWYTPSAPERLSLDRNVLKRVGWLG